MSEGRNQLTRAFLLVLTVAVVVAAVINFKQQAKVRMPDDGVFWSERDGRVVALMVQPESPAARAGVHEGDFLLRINRQPVNHAQDVARIFVGLPSWERVDYSLLQNGVEFEAHVILGERTLSTLVYYQYFVGGVYLLIGLFIFFRRGVAAQSLHVYILCLASFVLSTFHFTGRLDDFDKVMYWGNVLAGLITPTIFLHFCLSFPESGRFTRGFWRPAMLYLPAAAGALVYMGFASGIIRTAAPEVEVNWMLDRMWLAFLTGVYLLCGLVLAAKSRTAKDPIVRMQLKWLRNGAIFAILPFAIFYAIPYVMGGFPGESAKLAVLALLLMPLTWAYAIVRYRLMDVDVIFQQGYVYTLATIAVLGVFYIFIFSIGSFNSLSPTAVAILILIAAFAFQPIRNWLQEQLDKHVFYKDQYNYRRTLIEFARELGAETDLDKMLASVADRLIRTVGISHIAFFLAEEGSGEMLLRQAENVRDRKGRAIEPGYALDLSFLNSRPERGYLFFERTRHLPDPRVLEFPPAARESISDLDLTYYFPCDARGRTIAWFGVSRLDRGDFLTSDDLELLITLSGYVGIAIENALLYQSLRHKAAEYERLKEYNENIVESINVGILAADLAGRVESWNSTMEALTGVPRHLALGRRVEELLPGDLCREIASVGAAESVHNIYEYEFKASMLPHVLQQATAEMLASGALHRQALTLPVSGNAWPDGTQPRRSPSQSSIALADGVSGYVQAAAAPGYSNSGSSGLETAVREGAGFNNGNRDGTIRTNRSLSDSESEPRQRPEELTLNIVVTPLISREFEHIGRLVLFQDVTERTELERRLVQSDKLTSIGVLAAGVAHEVNTPLAVISSYSQMLAKQLAGDERKSGLLDKIAKQTFRASEIVNSLLNFSRTASATYSATDLNRVIEETLVLIGPQLEKADVAVECNFETPLPAIRGNGSKLQQVFLNVMLNARDSMADGGTLRIETSANASSVRVRVADTGHGIPADKLARIFDPFYTTKMAGKGTGLGLSISYGIVREHGGIIEVSSRVGEGATFVMEFPREQRGANA